MQSKCGLVVACLVVLACTALAEDPAIVFKPLTLGVAEATSRGQTGAGTAQYFSVTTGDANAKLLVTMDDWIKSATVRVIYAADTPPTATTFDEQAESDLTSGHQYYRLDLSTPGPVSIVVAASGGYTIEVYVPLLSPAGVAGVTIGGIVLFLLILLLIARKTMMRALDSPDIVRFHSHMCMVVAAASAIAPIVMFSLGLSMPFLPPVFPILGGVALAVILVFTGRRTIEVNGVTKTLTRTRYWFLVFPSSKTIPLTEVANFIITRTYHRNTTSLMLTAVRTHGGHFPLCRVRNVSGRVQQLNAFIRRHTPEVARPNPLASGIAALAGVVPPMMSTGTALSYHPLPPTNGLPTTHVHQQAALQARINMLRQQQALLAAATGVHPSGIQLQSRVAPPADATVVAVPYATPAAVSAELPPSGPPKDGKDGSSDPGPGAGDAML